MPDPSSLLSYHAEDRSLRSVEDLSRHGRISPSFIRLCLSLGCPSAKGELSLAMLLDWLFENYPAVRAGCGLRPYLEVTDLPEAVTAKLNMGNAMVTLLEYSASRCTDLVSKRHLEVMIRCIDGALDR